MDARAVGRTLSGGITKHLHAKKRAMNTGIGADARADASGKMDWTLHAVSFDNILKGLNQAYDDASAGGGGNAANDGDDDAASESDGDDDDKEEEAKDKAKGSSKKLSKKEKKAAKKEAKEVRAAVCCSPTPRFQNLPCVLDVQRLTHRF